MNAGDKGGQQGQGAAPQRWECICILSVIYSKKSLKFLKKNI